jgi:nicotinate-nucleotide pyrophosphorylase (carboxylating)
MSTQLSTTVSNIDKVQLIQMALELAKREDLSDRGDITTLAIVEASRQAKAKVVCKQEAVIAGLAVFAQVLHSFDPAIKVDALIKEGERITSVPSTIVLLEGPARAILTGERLALNLLQRMSGIATLTSQFVALASPFGISIRDTRKTTPGLRVFEKEAVALAGGENHRFGLFDAILIKDNHIEIAGSIDGAIATARRAAPGVSVQAEAATLEQVRQAVSAGVDAILLDNMAPAMVAQAVQVINGACFVEVSGGINIDNLKNYLIAGVNAISVGALTHSAPNIDISLEVEI